MTSKDEFVVAVFRMRIAQKDYFKKPITGKLLRAKALEKEVDEVIAKAYGELTLPYAKEQLTTEVTY